MYATAVDANASMRDLSFEDYLRQVIAADKRLAVYRERIASVAPNALPRVAIQARVGSPVAHRPWVELRSAAQAPQYRAPNGRSDRPRAAVGGYQPYRTAPAYQQRPAFSPAPRPAGRSEAPRR